MTITTTVVLFDLLTSDNSSFSSAFAAVAADCAVVYAFFKAAQSATGLLLLMSPRQSRYAALACFSLPSATTISEHLAASVMVLPDIDSHLASLLSAFLSITSFPCWFLNSAHSVSSRISPSSSTPH